MRIKLRTSVLLVASMVMPAFAAELYVGPGQAFASIQAAIDAAADGDTIVVLPGNYAGFSLSGKRLTILGSGVPYTWVGVSLIGPNGADDPVVIHGVSFRTVSPPPGPIVTFPGFAGITCTGNGPGPTTPCGPIAQLIVMGAATNLSLLDCEVLGLGNTSAGFHGVIVGGAAFSAFRCVLAGANVRNCNFFGPPTGVSYGGSGLIGRCASVVLNDCYVVGQNGSGGSNASLGAVGYGGNGIVMEGGTLVAHETSFYGGFVTTGGPNPYLFGVAGDGVRLFATAGRIASHGTKVMLGGLGGSPGAAIAGTSSLVVYSMLLCANNACSPSAPVSTAPYQTFPRLSLNGPAAVWLTGEFVLADVPPGAPVALFVQTTPAVQALSISSGFFGDLLIAPFALPVASGFADATGRFTLPVDFGLVPADFVEIGLFLQAGAFDPATNLLLASNALGIVIR